MPEMNESEVPTTSQISKKRNERTGARFFEDTDQVISETECFGAQSATAERKSINYK